MLASLGHNILLLALLCTLYNIGVTVAAYRAVPQRRTALLASAHNSTLALYALISLASGLMVFLFLSDDFSVSYVWEHSAKAQPLQFKISALWAGQAGSLLFWTFLLCSYAALIALSGKRHETLPGGDPLAVQLAPTAAAVVNSVSLLFVGIICFVANPFAPTQPVPPDGSGMNPLLQNYWMQIHPPTLYLGYVGCSVPFAWAVAALFHRQFGKDWVSLVRRWSLLPWLILTLGILMGGVWAYETLGWGGYWAWDPVENASLLPWLTATAFLHSIMIQARRGMLKNWNMVLVTLTFLLSIFGTFLTRSGVVSSVHSFAASNIGGYFLAYLGVALILSFGLIYSRRQELVSEVQFESWFSREGAFLLNNWLLVCSMLAVLWGTIYPTVREFVDGTSVTVGATYFNKVMVPLGLAILALAGVGPLMAWRRTTPLALLKRLTWPICAGVAMLPLLYFLSAWHTGAVTAFCLGVFVAFGIFSEFIRGTWARAAMTGESLGTAFGNLITSNRRRYGGYFVHLGVALMFAGFAGSSGFKIETEPITLHKGETMRVGEYTLRFDGLMKPEGELSPEKLKEIAAQMSVFLLPPEKITQTSKPFVVLHPSVDFFKVGAKIDPSTGLPPDPEMARRPDIMSNLANDLYLALIDFNEKEGAASVKAYLNPLVMWIWISTVFFIGGTILSMWPESKKRRVAAMAPSAGAAQSGNAKSGNAKSGDARVATLEKKN